MKILFIIKRSGTAGVETLLIRLANALIEAGHEPHILFMIKGNDKEFFELLNPKIKLYSSTSLKDLKSLKAASMDFVYTFESIGLLWFLLLRKLINKNAAKLCIGAYHPMEYFWEKPISSFIQKVISSVICQFPTTNIFFMNEAVMARFTKFSGIEIPESQVLPLPIDFGRFSKIQRTPVHGKFVSVGRLVDFKTYNLHSLKCIKDLSDKGYNVTYDVYGDGELESEMREYIAQNNLTKVVTLHGAVPYKNLEEVFKNAYCFIGCGTALLEAAAAGVPSIVGVESVTTPVTTGFFSDSKGANVGEYVDGMELESYIPFMENLLNSSSETYNKIESQHKNRAQDFTMSSHLKLFINMLQNAKNFNLKFSRPKVVAWFISYFTQKALSRFGISTTLHRRYVNK